MLGIISAIVLGALVLVAWHERLDLTVDEIRSIVELVFTPSVTLLGAVTGFYYATHRDEKTK